MISKIDVKKELSNTVGEEFDYHSDIASINAVKTGPNSVEVGHFVVKKDERRKDYGSTIFEALLDVLRENKIYTVTIKIQAVDDGSKNDTVMKFLRNYNFEYRGTVQDFNWGLCIKAYGDI